MGTPPPAQAAPDVRADRAVPDDAERPPDAASRPSRDALEIAGVVIAATTLISALAFYFGWAITSTKLAYFGIDASAIGFSAQDYILRSTDALFVPLGTLVVLALAVLTLHAVVTRAIADARRRPLLRRIARGAAAVGGVLFAIGLYGAINPLPASFGDLFTAASPGIGIGLLAYCLHVVALVDAAGRPRDSPPARSPMPRHGLALVVMLVALSAFWTVAVFAAEQGRLRGKALAANLRERPTVTVFSPKALHLAGAGATVGRLGGADSAYRYRYGGLRLIFHANGKYFLVAETWRPSKGAAVVLADDPSLRFEFGPGSGAA